MRDSAQGFSKVTMERIKEILLAGLLSLSACVSANLNIAGDEVQTAAFSDATKNGNFVSGGEVQSATLSNGVIIRPGHSVLGIPVIDPTKSAGAIISVGVVIGHVFRNANPRFPNLVEVEGSAYYFMVANTDTNTMGWGGKQIQNPQYWEQHPIVDIIDINLKLVDQGRWRPGPLKAKAALAEAKSANYFSGVNNPEIGPGVSAVSAGSGHHADEPLRK